MKTTHAPKPAARHLPETYGASWQPETLAEIAKLAPGTIAARDMLAGMQATEPLLVMMDAALRMAKAYRARFDQPMGEDYMARPEISTILSGIRGMLNFDGAAAWERQARDLAGHDSKDNGVIESLFWKACEIAGIDGNDI